MSDLVHDVEAILCLRLLLTISKNLFCNMRDVRETANCSFTGITYVSGKIFQTLLAVKECEV